MAEASLLYEDDDLHSLASSADCQPYWLRRNSVGCGTVWTVWIAAQIAVSFMPFPRQAEVLSSLTVAGHCGHGLSVTGRRPVMLSRPLDDILLLRVGDVRGQGEEGELGEWGVGGWGDIAVPMGVDYEIRGQKG